MLGLNHELLDAKGEKWVIIERDNYNSLIYIILLSAGYSLTNFDEYKK